MSESLIAQLRTEIDNWKHSVQVLQDKLTRQEAVVEAARDVVIIMSKLNANVVTAGVIPNYVEMLIAVGNGLRDALEQADE